MTKKQKEVESKKSKGLRISLVSEMLKLSTASFGLVSALAWNEVVKESIDKYIRPILGEGSGILYLSLYATTVTALAVFVTYHLSKFRDKI